MNTASPGAMSRTSWNERLSSATLSEANIHSVPRGVSRRPSTRGRMPFGSRKPRMPWPDDHGHDGITAAAAAINRIQGREHVRRRDARRADPLQLGSKHIQQHLRIGRGVEMAAVLAADDLGELRGVGQIAVVGETDAVGRVHVERLGLGDAVATGGGIADMPDADIAFQLEHVLLLEHIAHQATALAHAQPAIPGCRDTRRILTAMLQHRQSVINTLIDCARTDDADNSAHA
jgi:hypothetical protein